MVEQHGAGAAGDSGLSVLAPMRGWLWPLSMVPDEGFAKGLLGPGVALDPLDGLVVAPCDGVIVTCNASGHAVVVRHASGVELLVHVGIDTVGMDGRGFERLIRVGDVVRAGAPLIRCDLDAVIDAGHSLISPVVVVAPADARLEAVSRDGPVAVGAPIFRVCRDNAARDGAVANGAAVSRAVRIGLAHGVHARPAAALARLLREGGVRGRLRKAGGEPVDATSVVALMGLGIAHGDCVELTLSGPDAALVLARAADLLAGDFAESAPVAASPSVSPTSAGLGQGQLAGLPGSAGIALGLAYRHRPKAWIFPEAGAGVGIEQARLTEALTAALADVEREQAHAAGAMGEVLAAHRELLADPSLIDAARARISAGQSAGFAWAGALGDMAAIFARGDARLAERRGDLADVERRVADGLAAAGHGSGAAPADLPPRGAIVVAHDLLPSDLAVLAAAGVAGVALAGSGPSAHVAIIAAGMGMPLLTALGVGLDAIGDGARLILDADAGVLHCAPDAAAWQAGVARVARRQADQAAEREAAAAPAITRDGVAMEVLANLGAVNDVAGALAQGAEGCGLLRSEFLFLNRDTAPDEAVQAEAYRQIARGLGARPLTIRTLDVGGDKPVRFLDLPQEANPALGLRGIRIGLQWPELLDSQLRAVLGGCAGAPGPVSVMVPMIAGLDEWRAVRAAMARAVRQVGPQVGAAAMPLGLMIETPAAVLLADRFAAEADFLSIGSNDLAQYILAMDRTADSMAAKADALHPAVLRAIAQVIAAGQAADCPVSLCGGLAGDPAAIPVLVGLGLDKFSMAPALIPAAKRLIRGLDHADCVALAKAALAADSARDVRQLVRDAGGVPSGVPGGVSSGRGEEI